MSTCSVKQPNQIFIHHTINANYTLASVALIPSITRGVDNRVHVVFLTTTQHSINELPSPLLLWGAVSSACSAWFHLVSVTVMTWCDAMMTCDELLRTFCLSTVSHKLLTTYNFPSLYYIHQYVILNEMQTAWIHDTANKLMPSDYSTLQPSHPLITSTVNYIQGESTMDNCTIIGVINWQSTTYA